MKALKTRQCRVFLMHKLKYEQWKEIPDSKYGKGKVDTERKKAYNEKADRQQFERYKTLLGNNSPKKFVDFQKIKYGEDWDAFKAYSKSIKTDELTPFADFDLYKEIGKEMDEKLVGKVTSNGVLITEKSKHSIARVIGSVEQRRNGVKVDDIVDALTSKDADVLPVREMSNGRSQKFSNGVVEVSINPDTGNIIQVNPIHQKRRVKN